MRKQQVIQDRYKDKNAQLQIIHKSEGLDEQRF